MQQSNAMAVKQFTEEASGISCPETPVPMSRESVLFIIRMVMSELDELAATVSNNSVEKEALMLEAFNSIDKCNKGYVSSHVTNRQVIAAQSDALVDAWYYSLNVAAKHGQNLSKIFDLVHEANMAKRNPVTGKFERRESDGKIIKPQNWKEPDIEAGIALQFENKSWS